MKHSIEFSKATREDMESLVREIRPEDAAETMMAGFSDFAAATMESYDSSSVCFSARIRGDLMFVFGARETGGNTAVIWEIGTRLVRENAKDFIRATADAMRLVFEATPRTMIYFNYIPATYAGYIAWAKKHLNAEFDSVPVISKCGFEFVRFVVKKGA